MGTEYVIAALLSPIDFASTAVMAFFMSSLLHWARLLVDFLCILVVLEFCRCLISFLVRPLVQRVVVDCFTDLDVDFVTTVFVVAVFVITSIGYLVGRPIVQ